MALRLYYEVDARIQNKLPATTRKFADVAKHAINRMETEIHEGVGKQAYRDYVQALNKWLIPYFGTIDIAKLDLAAVTAFDAWHKLRLLPKSLYLRQYIVRKFLYTICKQNFGVD